MKPKTRAIITAGALLLALGGGLVLFLSARPGAASPLAGIFTRRDHDATARSGDQAGKNARTSQRPGDEPQPGSPEFEEIMQAYMRGDRSHEKLIRKYVDRSIAGAPLDFDDGVTAAGKRRWQIRDSEAAEIKDLLADTRKKVSARIRENLAEVTPDHARRTLRYKGDPAIREELQAKLEQIGGSGFANAGLRQLRQVSFALGERDLTITLDPEPQPPEVQRNFSGNVVEAPAPIRDLQPQRVIIRYFDPQGQLISSESSSSIGYLSRQGLDISDP